MMKVMMSGLPGKMTTKVAEHLIKDKRFKLFSLAFTGEDVERKTVKIGNMVIGLIPPHGRDSAVIEDIRKNHAPLIIVDFTQRDAGNLNAEFYCRHEIPFVMGTTGVDQDALVRAVRGSNISAVYAPNMAKQIVAFQAMMEYAAQNFPKAFVGFSLEITESHQQGKKDTSGTARAMVKYFNALGIPFTENQIIMIRDPYFQEKEMGIPKEALSGHGWHTYTLRSADGTVLFQFTHNVNGRDPYARGTLDAIIFLDQQIKAGSKGKVYSMIDVLKVG